MMKAKNQIDLNDLMFVQERNGLAISASPCPQDKITGKINPHVSQFKILGAENGQTVSVFHVKPIYYEHASSTDEEMVWRPMYEVCSHYGNHRVVFEYDKLPQVHPRFVEWLKKRMKLINGQILVTSPFSPVPSPYSFIHEIVHTSIVRPRVGLTTTTVYPDPDPETTTVDGYVARDGQVETWATAHDNATGTGASAVATASNMCYTAEGFTTNAKWVYRAVFLFDASAITDTDTIDSAVFSVFVTTIYDEGLGDNTKEYTVLCSSNPASNTTLATSDYDYNDFGTTAFSNTIADTTGTPNAYYDYTLNASGLAAVSKTGVTKFALRHGYDITNTEPIAASTYKNNGITGGRWADYTGTTSDPKLVITHSAGVVNVTVSPSAQVGSFTIPAYTVSLPKVVSVTPQTATFSIPTYTAGGMTVVSPSAQALTFSIPVYDVKTYVLLTPDGQVLTYTIPAYTVVVEANITIAPNTIVLTFTTPTLAKVGGVWDRTARGTSATWSRSSRNVDDWDRASRNSN